MELTFKGDSIQDLRRQLASFLEDLGGPAPVREEAKEVPEVKKPKKEATLPTASAKPAYTKEQLAIALVGIRDRDGTEEVAKIIGSFGAKTLGEVPAEQYAALAQVIKNAGGAL